jgi:hypothetical protein
MWQNRAVELDMSLLAKPAIENWAGAKASIVLDSIDKASGCPSSR